MTHASETGVINGLHFFLAPCVMSCHVGTGFVWCRIPAPIRTLFYSKQDSDVYVTEMIIYDFFPFHLTFGYNASDNKAAAAANSSSTSLLATFIFGTRNFHSRPIWYEKPAPKIGVDLWRRFLERVS